MLQKNLKITTKNGKLCFIIIANILKDLYEFKDKTEKFKKKAKNKSFIFKNLNNF